MMDNQIELTVNGEQHLVSPGPGEMLSETLRQKESAATRIKPTGGNSAASP